mgnify:CR=1 FL=1
MKVDVQKEVHLDLNVNDSPLLDENKNQSPKRKTTPKNKDNNTSKGK